MQDREVWHPVGKCRVIGLHMSLAKFQQFRIFIPNEQKPHALHITAAISNRRYGNNCLEQGDITTEELTLCIQLQVCPRIH
jgi:hypothetical protein